MFTETVIYNKVNIEGKQAKQAMSKRGTLDETKRKIDKLQACCGCTAR